VSRPRGARSAAEFVVQPVAEPRALLDPALSSPNLRVLGIRGSFTFELTKMLVEEIVGYRDHPVVRHAPLPALVAAISRIAARRGSNANSTRMSLAGGMSSVMFLCLDCLIVSTSDCEQDQGG
jgi:hypothetical protein